jgi:DMSO reductase anchor subunit
MTSTQASPRQLKVWGWPVVLNFTLGGAGAGWFLVHSASVGESLAPDWTGVMLAVALVAAGLMAVSFEAGAPLQARYSLANLKSSWMSREVLAALVFALSATISGYGRQHRWTLVAQASAIAFILTQGLVVRNCRGVPAWNSAWIPVRFLTTGLASGVGVGLLCPAGMNLLQTKADAVTALSIAGLEAFASLSYFGRAKGPKSLFSRLSVLVPWSAVLILLYLWGRCESSGFGATLWTALAGCSLLAGSLLQKTRLILQGGGKLPVGLATQKFCREEEVHVEFR